MTTTEKAKHTGGPWKVMQGSINFPPLLVRAAQSDKAIADCDYQDGAEGEANARLIAAAPELLSALEAARDYHWDGTPLEAMSDLERHTLEQIENAIRKAKGE